MRTLLAMVLIVVIVGYANGCAKDPNKETCKKLQKEYYLMARYFASHGENLTGKKAKEFAVADRDHNGIVDGRDLQLLLDEVKAKDCKNFKR